MTAPSYAQPAAVHLAQLDNVAAENAMTILRDTGIPARHRARRAADILTRHVTSRRRRILAGAVEAERHAEQEVAS